MDWIAKTVAGLIGPALKSYVAANFPMENVYPTFGDQGKILSYIENVPVLGKILKSLGPNRTMLYEAALNSKPDDLVRRVFSSLFLVTF
jgi:hypothetical protein